MHRRNTDIYRRGRQLRQGKSGKGPVVYWMSRDYRVHDNWGLLWAQQEAIVYERGLLVVMCLTPQFPPANLRQMHFLVEGLQPVAQTLQELGIGLIFEQNGPDNFLPKFLNKIDAHSLVCDFNPLKHQKSCNETLRQKLSIPIFEVDSHNIIPAWTTSSKKEYAAYTIRPKIKRLLGDFLTDIPTVLHHPISLFEKNYLAHKMWDISSLKERGHASPISIPSGPDKALEAAETFIRNGLISYDSTRNDPCKEGQSGLSPYLHFGQLSAHRLAQMTIRENFDETITEPFLEELIVRRELSDNFCLYEDHYDRTDGFSDWAQKTLGEHRGDRREYTYTLDTFEKGTTHEQLWNCCQHDLVLNGKLHGFLRMYWAKKILEWTKNPETAIKYAITLNDKYSIDGHDPNGYTGVAWSIGGVHDRAWGERPVFGKIRYMNEAGCRRKFNTKSYIARIIEQTNGSQW